MKSAPDGTTSRGLRIMTVYGTRPEAIKMAPLVTALSSHPDMSTVVVVTGQHREMLDQVNRLFGIVPDIDLDVMRSGARLAELSSRVLLGMQEVLDENPVDALVVQGDTTTAWMAGLAAFYAQVPVIHLEAGLRTGDMSAPFPEEGNRRLLAVLAQLHLAPTPTSRDALLREGTERASVYVTGNTVIDALQLALERPVSWPDGELGEVATSGKPVLLVTAHRRESWGEPMAEAMMAVRDLAQTFPDLRVVIPMHRNSVVRDVIGPTFTGIDNVLLTEPLDYHTFTHLMAASHLVLTDSGGVQEEAPSLGKPVLVMRDTTERPEAVSAGTVRLVGTDRATIVDEVSRLLTDPDAYALYAQAVNPYGDGLAAGRGVSAIAALFSVGERDLPFQP